MIEKAKYRGPYEDFMIGFRSHIEALARSAVLYDSQLHRFSAVRATDWVWQDEAPFTECERESQRANVRCEAQSVRQAFYVVVYDLEQNFAETFADAKTVALFGNDLDLLRDVFATRAAGAKLWSTMLERHDAVDESGELHAATNLPLPSAAEMDSLLAHCIKLAALMDVVKETDRSDSK